DASQLAFDGIESTGALDEEKPGYVVGHAFDSGEVWIGAATHGTAAVDGTDGLRLALLQFKKLGHEPDTVAVIASQSGVLSQETLSTFANVTWSGVQRGVMRTARLGEQFVRGSQPAPGVYPRLRGSLADRLQRSTADLRAMRRADHVRLPVVPDHLRNSATAPVDIQSSEVTVAIDPNDSGIEVERVLELRAAEATSELALVIYDQFGDLDVTTRVDGVPVTPTLTPLPAYGMHLIQVPFSEPYEPDDTFTVEVGFSGTANCDVGTLGVTWCGIDPGLVYFLDGSFVPIVVDLSPTQSGVDDFDSALNVVLPQAYRIGATGERIDSTPLGDGTSSTRFEGKHVVSPAFCASTDFVEASRQGAKLPLRALVRSDNEAVLDAGLTLLDDVLDYHSDRLGPLPYESMGFTEIPASVGVGGLGNATHVFLSGAQIVDPASDPYTIQLFAHEFGHQWIGNLLPTANEDAFWLQEGNTEFVAYDYVKHWSTSTRGRDLSVDMRWTYIMLYMFGGAVDTDLPLVPGNAMSQDPYTFFLLNYVKGGTVIESLVETIGEDPYLAGMRAMMQAQGLTGGMSVPVFKAAMEAASGRDLTAFFDQWVYGTGFPRYAIHVEAEPAAGGGFELTFHAQSDDVFEVPATIALYDRQEELERFSLDLSQGETSKTVHVDTCPARYVVDPQARFVMAHRPALAGDVTRDGEVDGMDLMYATASAGARGDDFLKKPGHAYRYTMFSDFDLDGDVDDADVGALVSAFGESHGCSRHRPE
ncbi:MAG: M1 family metallopeptidase, partial [Myxococcota bacterium]